MITIFANLRRKIGFFLKNQWYDRFFGKNSSSWIKKRQYFRQIFRRKYFLKIITAVAGWSRSKIRRQNEMDSPSDKEAREKKITFFSKLLFYFK
jgi:hypothetical protein